MDQSVGGQGRNRSNVLPDSASFQKNGCFFSIGDRSCSFVGKQLEAYCSFGICRLQTDFNGTDVVADANHVLTTIHIPSEAINFQID
jgi:hypothetical protein